MLRARGKGRGADYSTWHEAVDGEHLPLRVYLGRKVQTMRGYVMTCRNN